MKKINFINKDFGDITNPKTGNTKKVEVKMGKGNLVDAVIGCGIIGIGIAYLMYNSFYRGANEFMKSEEKVLDDLDLFEK